MTSCVTVHSNNLFTVDVMSRRSPAKLFTVDVMSRRSSNQSLHVTSLFADQPLDLMTSSVEARAPPAVVNDVVLVNAVGGKIRRIKTKLCVVNEAVNVAQLLT